MLIDKRSLVSAIWTNYKRIALSSTCHAKQDICHGVGGFHVPCPYPNGRVAFKTSAKNRVILNRLVRDEQFGANNKNIGTPLASFFQWTEFNRIKGGNMIFIVVLWLLW